MLTWAIVVVWTLIIFRYKFTDYTRVGLPLQVILSFVSVGVIYWKFA
jgi:di/tricarboxylate transporter